MSTRIFSKKAFAIGPGAEQGTDTIDLFTTIPGAFQDMPDRFKNDATFRLAVRCGDITVINNSTDEKRVEENSAARINDKAAVSVEKEFFEHLKTLDNKSTFEMGERYNLAIQNNEKLGAFKKRIFEAYKVDSLDTSRKLNFD